MSEDVKLQVVEATGLDPNCFTIVREIDLPACPDVLTATLSLKGQPILEFILGQTDV